MKKVIVLCMALSCVTAGFAQKNKASHKQTKPAMASASASEPTEIKWMSFEEAVKLAEKKPKKLLIDLYTDWCGWCKRMDATTFRDPVIVKYVSENYYAVKFNAESRDTILFKNTKYSFKPEYKANELAVNLMNGQMSYPTIVYLDEQLNMLSPVPGFQNASSEEMIIKFFGENAHKTTKWDEYQKNFKGEVAAQ